MLVLLFCTIFSCAPTEAEFHITPIELTPEVQAQFEQYLAMEKPGFFVVSDDGRYYAFSSHSDTTRASNNQMQPIWACEKASGGTPCRIYARKRSVISEH